MKKLRRHAEGEIFKMRTEQLTKRGREFQQDPPEDRLENSYYSWELVILNRNDTGRTLSTGDEIPPHSSRRTQEFLAQKITSEEELYKFIMHENDGGRIPTENSLNPRHLTRLFAILTAK